MKEGIMLIGMAGVGKSSVGKILAEKLGLEFVDGDDEILKQTGKTVAEIIATEGDQAFMETEKQVIQNIDLRKKALAPGGSVVYYEDLINWIKKKVAVVYLQDSFENIIQRLEAKQGLQNIPGLQAKSLEQIFEERVSLYEKYADLIVNVENKSLGQIADIIEKKIW